MNRNWFRNTDAFGNLSKDEFEIDCYDDQSIWLEIKRCFGWFWIFNSCEKPICGFQDLICLRSKVFDIIIKFSLRLV
jgi:hypothetical protein